MYYSTCMKKYLTAFVVLFVFITGFAQMQNSNKYDLDRVKFVCQPSSQEIKDLYTTGFAAMKSEGNIDIAGKIFLNILNKDESMCDAHFWIGVCLTEMKKEKNAVMYFYYADSLATKSNLIFKRELAEAGIRVGLLGLADQKYTEIIRDFPNETEGYLGLAVVATSSGNVKDGLSNLVLAESKLDSNAPLFFKQQNQIQLMYGILYTLRQEYEKAIEHLEKCKDSYKALDDWNANYAWATYNMYLNTHKIEWRQASEHALSQIKDKDNLKESFLNRFQYD